MSLKADCRHNGGVSHENVSKRAATAFDRRIRSLSSRCPHHGLREPGADRLQCLLEASAGNHLPCRLARCAPNTAIQHGRWRSGRQPHERRRGESTKSTNWSWSLGRVQGRPVSTKRRDRLDRIPSPRTPSDLTTSGHPESTGDNPGCLRGETRAVPAFAGSPTPATAGTPEIELATGRSAAVPVKAASGPSSDHRSARRGAAVLEGRGDRTAESFRRICRTPRHEGGCASGGRCFLVVVSTHHHHEPRKVTR